MSDKFDYFVMLSMLKISRKLTLVQKLTSIHFLDCFYIERHTEKQRRRDKISLYFTTISCCCCCCFYKQLKKLVVFEYGALFSSVCTCTYFIINFPYYSVKLDQSSTCKKDLKIFYSVVLKQLKNVHIAHNIDTGKHKKCSK